MKRKMLFVLLSLGVASAIFGETFEPMEGYVDAKKAVPEAAQFYIKNAERGEQKVYALWYDRESAKNPYGGIAVQIAIQNSKSIDQLRNLSSDDWKYAKIELKKILASQFNANNIGKYKEDDLQVLFSNDQGGQFVETEDSIACAKKMDVECRLGYASQKVKTIFVIGMVCVKGQVYGIIINQTNTKSLKDTLSLFSKCVSHMKQSKDSSVIDTSDMRDLNLGKYETRWTSTGMAKAQGLEVQVDLPNILKESKVHQPHSLTMFSTNLVDKGIHVQVLFTVNPVPEELAAVIKAYNQDEPMEIDPEELEDFLPKSSWMKVVSASLIRKAGVSGLVMTTQGEKYLASGQKAWLCSRNYMFPATKGRGFQIAIMLSSMTQKVTPREMEAIDPMCSLILNSLTFLKPAQFDVHRVWGKGCGTGWFISPNLLVTCAHVIGDYEDISFKTENGKRVPCRVVAKDEFEDLVVLKAMQPTKTYLRIGEDAGLATEVFTLGYPNPDVMGTTIKYTTGVISATTGLQGDPLEYQFTAPVQPGNSGGPLFDSSGKVVGVVVSRLESVVVETLTESKVQNVNFAIKISALRNLLKKNNLSLPAKSTSLSTSNRSELVAELVKAVVLLQCE